MAVYSEVPRTGLTFTATGDMNHKGVEWRELAFKASVVESLHESSNQLTLPTEMQVLWRREPCRMEDTGIGHGLCAIDGAVVDAVVDGCVDLRLRHVSTGHHV